MRLRSLSCVERGVLNGAGNTAAGNRGRSRSFAIARPPLARRFDVRCAEQPWRQTQAFCVRAIHDAQSVDSGAPFLVNAWASSCSVRLGRRFGCGCVPLALEFWARLPSVSRWSTPALALKR
eukprot:6184806-Pleurochrysis_carterae.AAC.3